LYQSTALPLEVIVVDNASTDHSRAIVQEAFPAVRILELPENRGFAGGCNAGIRAATAPYILILNNDTVHTSGWIEYLVAKLESEPEIAVVQPKLRSFQDQSMFDYSGAAGGELDLFVFPFARGRLFEKIEKDEGQYDQLPERIFWASGTAFLARRKLLIKAGLFDEVFFAHMEEIDLEWRLQLMGYRIVAEPRAVVYHRSGYTLGAEAFLKKYLNHRNSLLVLVSNYSLLLMLYLFPLRLLLDYLALGFSLYKGDLPRMWAIIKAQAWIFCHPRLICRKRRLVKSLRQVRDRELVKHLYRGSVALKSYLLGCKKYSEI
jgi:GT2 family glycosyltransferase